MCLPPFSLCFPLSLCFASERVSDQRNHNAEKPGKQTPRVNRVKQRGPFSSPFFLCNSFTEFSTEGGIFALWRWWQENSCNNSKSHLEHEPPSLWIRIRTPRWDLSPESFLFSATPPICLQCRRPGFDPWVRKIPWRREWQPTPVFLPGESHGQSSLVGYSPWRWEELDRTERLILNTRPTAISPLFYQHSPRGWGAHSWWWQSSWQPGVFSFWLPLRIEKKRSCCRRGRLTSHSLLKQ